MQSIIPPKIPKDRLQNRQFQQEFKQYVLDELLDLVTIPRLGYTNPAEIVYIFEQEDKLRRDIFTQGLLIRCGQDAGMTCDEIAVFKERWLV